MTAIEPKPVTAQIWLRSAVFWCVFLLSTILFAPTTLLCAPFPFRFRYRYITLWTRFNLWALKTICGLRYRVHGAENIPPSAAIVFSNHQSTWETLALQVIFPPQVWVVKRELLWIPFFGWGLAMLNPIAINRSKGREAMDQLVRDGRERLENNRWVVIFPEGTRVAPGKVVRYRLGGAVLAEKSGFPVVPVAHNAGLFWPRHSFVKHPGTIDLAIGPPITSEGRTAKDTLAQAEQWIRNAVSEYSA